MKLGQMVLDVLLQIGWRVSSDMKISGSGLKCPLCHVFNALFIMYINYVYFILTIYILKFLDDIKGFCE